MYSYYAKLNFHLQLITPDIPLVFSVEKKMSVSAPVLHPIEGNE